MKPSALVPLSLALLLWPLNGLAQTVPDATATCVAAARTDADRQACIGLAAQACIAAIPKADDTDAAACLNTEAAWWQTRMREAYARMQAKSEKLDRRFAAQMGSVSPTLTEDLAKTQEAWQAWTDQRCFFEAMQRRGKLDRPRVASACQLHRIAEQALYLDASAAE
jgi:uncharacterized protein YecT (DUF1311 family)